MALRKKLVKVKPPVYVLPKGPRGDSPARGRNEGGRQQDMADAPVVKPRKKRRRTGDNYIG